MKVRFFIFLFFFKCFTSFAQNISYERHWKDNMEKIRIISYNIFIGFDRGKDQERRERFVDWIIEQDPEILAMQELCGFTQESLLTLAKQWGHEYAVILKETGYPVGITSKQPITLKNKLLENYGHGLLHIETYDYDILVTHLNPNNYHKRNEEAQLIVKYIKDNELDRYLLMGDMNSHSPFDGDYMESYAYELLKHQEKSDPNLLNGEFDYSVIANFLSVPMIDLCRIFTKPEKRATFPTPILMTVSKHLEIRQREQSRIDFIFAAPSVVPDVVDAFIWNEGEVDYLSDHYPIGIDLCISKTK